MKLELNTFKYIMLNIRGRNLTVFFLFFLLSPISSWGQMNFTLNSPEAVQSVDFQGSFDEMYFSYLKPSIRFPPGARVLLIKKNDRDKDITLDKNYPYCDGMLPNINKAREHVRSVLAAGGRAVRTSGPLRAFSNNELRLFIYTCLDRTVDMVADYRMPMGQDISIVNPPTEDSACSLNNQSISLYFSSDKLNVAGLTKETNLTITCSNGDAKNYQLKLTGSNITNGRLNFGNGFSAQISLNGTDVYANGAGISLNGLTNRTIPVRASLVGTAGTSGTSAANGILILDAQ